MKFFFPETGEKLEKKGVSLIALSLLVSSHPGHEAHVVPALPACCTPLATGPH